jgi:hypothetical protein
MKKKLHLVTGLLMLLASGASYAQSYQPLTISSGYNQDAIANGVGTALSSTTIAVDNANFAFVSNDYRATANGTAPAYSLPTNGLIASAAAGTAGLSYQLAPYTGNNDLKLITSGASGTLVVGNQIEATSLYLLATSGSLLSTMDVTVNFTDGTAQTFTSVEVPDWYGGTSQPTARKGTGRINRTTNATEGSADDPRLYQITLAISQANQTKLVQSIQITKTNATGHLNVFAVSAKVPSDCPELASVSAAAATFSTGNISWTLASEGASANITYTVEVYTNAAMTTPLAGSPFTGITGLSQAVSGLSLETTYYYRVKANNGICDSNWVTGSFTQGYCVPAVTTPTSYFISNVTTTGGYTNISNTSVAAASGYTNYNTTQIISKPAGTSFDYSITRSNAAASLAVYVDWNNDLDFDDEGEIINSITGSFSGSTTATGTITIPAGTPLGNHRLRVRSVYYLSNTLTPCAATVNGETEDYTIAVIEQPLNCETPASPAVAVSNISASGITVTVTPATGAVPAGYILVRSNAPLTAQPALGATYAIGANLGGGKVVATGATLAVLNDFLNANTSYYYTVYAYNDGGVGCFGPAYSAAVSANGTTCAIATVNAGASNIGNFSADLNWTSVVGPGGTTTNYTVEVYTDAALTNLAGTYTTTANIYTDTELASGVTYYYRVKAETPGCGNDAWTSAMSFTTQSLYTPLTVTGFNHDVIASGTGIANLGTTAGVDGANNAYIALNYRNSASGSVTTVGLPVNRRLINSGVTGLEFLMADYIGNNSLRLAAQGQVGTLTLTKPIKATNLYASVASGSGDSTISAVINFTDGSSQPASTVSLLNWYSNGNATQPALVSGIGRANRANTVGNVETGASKVFYVTLPVDVENQNKSIASVTFSKTSIGATEPVPNVFSLSAQLINECPVLNSAFTFAAETSASVSFGLLAGSAPATSYTYSIYTDEAMTVPVTGSPFTTTNTSLSVTGLAASTTYYYSAVAVNDVCSSAAVTGSFTTNPTSGTDDFGKKSLTVYPNPAGAVLNVQAGENISRLVLVNLLGQTILEQTASNTQTQLNLGHVAAGTYILRVTAGNKITTAKVVKQ